MIEKWIATFIRDGWLVVSNVAFYNMFMYQPPMFEMRKDWIANIQWMEDMEGAFSTTFCLEEEKVRVVMILLYHAKRNCWSLMAQYFITNRVKITSCDDFTTQFREERVFQMKKEHMIPEFGL